MMKTKTKKSIGAKEALKQIKEAQTAPRKDHKIRITTMIDGDILDMLKGKAEANGVGYQTMLNTLLREYFETSAKISARMAAQKFAELEKAVQALKKQIA